MIKCGMRFWDNKNDTKLTVDGVGADPKEYTCLVEKLTWYWGEHPDYSFHIIGRKNLKENELRKMEVIE